MALAGSNSALDSGADLALTRTGREAGIEESRGDDRLVEKAGSDELAEAEGGAVQSVIALAGGCV